MLYQYCMHYPCESYSLLAHENLLDSLLHSLLPSRLKRAALRDPCFGRSKVFRGKLLANGKL